MAMRTTLKARYQNGVLRPLGELRLQENQEVTIQYPNESPVKPDEVARALAVLDRIEPMQISIEQLRAIAEDLP